MREILFKAKRIDEQHKGEWIEGYYVKSNNMAFIYPKIPEIISRALAKEIRPNHSVKSTQKRIKEVFPVDPKTVCMCTGLTDKDGRDVFEGDKLHCEYYLFGELYKKDYIVSWSDGNYFLKPIGTGLSDEFSIDILLSCEVIGNIYDDKEKE